MNPSILEDPNIGKESWTQLDPATILDIDDAFERWAGCLTGS